VKPPVARSRDIHLLGFSDAQPSRKIAMVWRRSSAMSDFLLQLAQVFRALPPELFTATPDLAPAPRRKASGRAAPARSSKHAPPQPPARKPAKGKRA